MGSIQDIKFCPKVEFLLINDGPCPLQFLESGNSDGDYSLIRKKSIGEALEIPQENRNFAAILVNTQVPELNGISQDKLHWRNSFRNTPIVFLTNSSDNIGKLLSHSDNGHTDIIQVPVSEVLVRNKINFLKDLFIGKQQIDFLSSSNFVLNEKVLQGELYTKALINAAPDPVVAINTEGIIKDANIAFGSITNKDPDKIRGEFLYNYFSEPELIQSICKDAIEKEHVSNQAVCIKNKDGKSTGVLINCSVCRDPGGKPTGITIVLREKTFSKYSLGLIESGPDPLITINSDGTITDLNHAVTNFTGISREKITGTHFFNYFTEPDKARLVCAEIFAKGNVVDFPLTISLRNRKPTDVLCNGSVYKDEKNNVLGAVITARDVTAQKRFENKLIRAKRNAEKARQIAESAVKAKQQFLSNMSHEIRTPMNAIVGFTKVVLKTELNEKQKEYLNAIKISGDALIVLINDILDLAKVDAGKMTFEQIPFNLSNSIQSVLQLFDAKIQEEEKLELENIYDPKLPDVIVGDPVRLNQIIMNLVGNAIKFTKDGKITVSAQLVKEDDKKVSVEFRVSDSGVGIPREKLESIFDYFQQADSSISRIYGGSGLGLAIVKQLVIAQGGTVKVKSRPGEGSTFIFTLSFLKEKENSKRKLADRNENEVITELSKDTIAHKIKVLVAEDVEFSQLLMRTLLEQAGFETDIASNGKAAIEKLKSNEYDIVLMDLQMPEMNGDEATKYIRETLHSTVPIIALTADVTTVNPEKCRSMGMNDYISKPVDDKLLFHKIRKLLKNKFQSPQTVSEPIHISDQEQFVNLDFLKQMTNNDPEKIARMIRVYLDEMPELLRSMRDSLNVGDWDAVRASAHSILPSFATVGMNKDYTLLAQKIQEHAAKRENTDEIGQLLSEIESGCNHACMELQKEMEVLSNLKPDVTDTSELNAFNNVKAF